MNSKIIAATNNQHKLEELKAIIGEKFNILSLKECNIHDDIPETGCTLNENALQKASYIYSRTKIMCFADDTGLEVEALNGAPGVISARYAGEPANSEKNIDLLLSNFEGKTNRNAQFRTIIALIENNNIHYFEGIIKGTIALSRSGNNGFGYDSIFIPDGYECSFAELSSEIKNSISHRALATQKLITFLNKNISNTSL